MSKIIPYGKHYIDEDDINSVIEVLKYKNLTQGDEVESFEKEVAKYVGAKYAVAISSWTSGLHLANLAIGVKEGDKVITSPITFVASSNAVIYCGGEPIFSDIEVNTINICPKKLEQTIKENSNIKAIIPVHYGGLPCDMQSISLIAKKYNLSIIEDAAHALGAKYSDGSMVGSCKFSCMTGFSFHPVKSIAAGEGGMITTNDEKIYKKLIRLRSHGINKLDDDFIDSKQSKSNGLTNPWYYEMQDLGYNYRITDFQCALGKSQLKKLDLFIERRKALVKRYDMAFTNHKYLTTIQNDYRALSSHHLYVIRINFEKINITRAQLMHRLREHGILTQVHYIPITHHPFYKKMGYNSDDYLNSLTFYNECLTLPLYYSLKDDDQDFIIERINQIIE
jgi:UDP-4-amino-4,6-dideoxy-N-acetyl-beta-L-altrosamine transaminase